MTTKQKIAATKAEWPKGREAQVVGPHDKLKEECGVFGIFGHPEAANLTYLGLYALQHRGQESAGIAASNGSEVRISKSMGYVADAFSEKTLERLLRSYRHRTRPVFDRRRQQGRQRATHSHRLRARSDCHRSQRQSRQRDRAEGRARPARVDISDQHRHRSHSASVCTVARRVDRRSRCRSDFARARGVFARADDQGSAHRHSRPARISPAGARQAWRGGHRVFGDVRTGSDWRHVRARCRTRRSPHRQRSRCEVVQAVPAGAACAVCVRARVFFASGQLCVRRERQRGAHESGASARA